MHPARPLTYAVGRTIHLGNRSIRTGLDLLSLDLTDDGVAFTTFDGLLWFTDGRTLRQIGLTTPGRLVPHGVLWSPAGRPNARIVSDPSGSRLAWLEYPRAVGRVETPDLVVYDTRQRERVARVSLRTADVCPACAQIASVHGDAVYWTDGPANGLGNSSQRLSRAGVHRFDVSTGRQTRLSIASYQAELRHLPRTLVVGESYAAGTVSDGVGQDFVLVGQSLVANGLDPGSALFEARSRQRIELRFATRPRSGFEGERFYLFEWLDDHTFALLAGAGWHAGSRRGEDVVLCTLPSGQCLPAPPAFASSGPRIVPGFETPAAGRAEARASRAPLLTGR